MLFIVVFFSISHCFSYKALDILLYKVNWLIDLD